MNFPLFESPNLADYIFFQMQYAENIFYTWLTVGLHLVTRNCPVWPHWWRLMHCSRWEWKPLSKDFYLWLSAVTLFSLLHIAVAALLSTIDDLDLWHVVQTHTHTFLQTGCKVLLAACAKHFWEWIPGRRRVEQREENEREMTVKENFKALFMLLL